MALNRKERQVEREANNAQTVQFVAQRQIEMADEASEMASKVPRLKDEFDLEALAELERVHMSTLMEVAAEQKQLATAIHLETSPPEVITATGREHRKDLLEIARTEGRLSEELTALSQENPELGALAEQAERNKEILRGVAANQGSLPKDL